ncbi:MAG: alanine dehydrogenase [candidate division NC10 bacterium RBG_16_65_8]|nr:MAG: alanine dehydrogenase [candidate division NC10 bacterium RBG_16_65_8]
METVLLNQQDIQQVVTMKDVVEIVEETFKGMGEGTVVNPTKVGLDLGESAAWPPYKGFMNAMPAYVGWLDSAGIKWAGGFLDNQKIGLPYISSMILLIDPKTGQFRAAMEGALITNLRTGAQSAVALKYFHPKKDLRLGLYGAGAQGRTQTRAMAEVFQIETLTVYDIRREAAEKFAAEMRSVVPGRIVIADSPQQAADGDAVICVTQSKDKFVKESWVKPGTALFPMGSYQECEDACILKADKIIVDHIGQCLHRGALKELNEAGKITEKQIYATIGEVVAGKKPARSAATERILCIPIGTGAMDIAVATVAYRRAVDKGLGRTFAFL